jgi:hypothetical protein
MNKTTKTFLSLITFLSVTAADPSHSYAADPSKQPKPPCRIQIGKAHISSWAFAKFGYRAVKVNAFSKCNVPQSKVTLTVEIWKRGKFTNTQVASTVVKSPGVTLPGRKVENLETLRRCKTFDETKYFGVASAKAFIQGKWQYARDTYSLEIESLKCGT